MNESIFKKIWNYSITVGQMIMTALAMAMVCIKNLHLDGGSSRTSDR